MASSSTRVRNYDVFLSFRGEDTRRTIVSFLYEALSLKGIYTFKDDRRLEAGDKISDQLIDAIKTSSFAVVVISKNYATSKWCLEELQLIMELHDAKLIKVVPMFYRVEPTDVRNQTGSFEPAFKKYEDLEMVPVSVSQWREALKKVGNLSGFHSTDELDEAAMIAKTVQCVSNGLLTMWPTKWVDLVGMEAHMVKMHFLLTMGSENENEVRMIGIWGMGGVGKTTIANCLYDRFSSQFQGHYFIKDIKKIYKDKSPSYLQKEFLRNILGDQNIGFLSNVAGSEEIKKRLGHRKVLVVLDGVDKAEQIHALAKETSWFGLGSRIIITTQDRGLLTSCGVNHIHEVKCLDDKDALQVFKKSVFRGRRLPSSEFEKLFVRASRLAHGLPSALVAYASSLSESTTIDRWEDELRLLETSPHKNVEEILRNSYDGLDKKDKIAFLHVACLLNGYPFNHVTSLLDDGRPRMNHLSKKALISISTDGCINMHFLVALTGKEIVRQECKNRLSRQRFLWDAEDIYKVLANKTGTDEIEGVTLDMSKMCRTLSMSNSVFEVIRSINFLKFFQQHLGDMKSNVQLMSNDFNFPPNLRLLHWDVYQLKTLPSMLQHYDLVEVNLRYSNLESLWDVSVNLPSLRRIDVTGSRNLRKLPNLSSAIRFEELIIEGCLRLQQIPESLERLTHLKKLNAIHCDILRGIKIRFRVTEFLLRKTEFSFTFGNNGADGVVVSWDCPRDLSIEGQINVHLLGIHGQADHISFRYKQDVHDALVMTKSLMLTGLQSLNIKQFRYREFKTHFTCKSFVPFPSLTELKLVNLNIQQIPNDIDCLPTLEKLDLSGNDFVHLPRTMRQLLKLKYLSLHNCRRITSLPQLARVETLILSDCVSLQELQRCLSKKEEALSWTVMEFCWDPVPAQYCFLELCLDNCKNVLDLSHQLHRLKRLTYLDLSRHDFVTLPQVIRELESLGTLYLNNCKKLISVERLPQSVKYLYAHGCDSLEKVSLSQNHSIKHVDLIHCPSLKREEHEHLKDLFIYDGHSQEGSERCACLSETGVSSDSGYETSETPAMPWRVYQRRRKRVAENEVE